MAHIEKWLNSFCKLFNSIAEGALFSMIFIPSFDVFLRVLFGKSILGAEELVSLVQVIVVFLALAYTAAKKGHIGVDLLYDRLPKRVQPIMNTTISLICMVLCSLTACQAFKHGREVWDSELTTVVLRIPVFPFEFLTALGFLLTALVFLTDFLRSCLSLGGFSGDES
jgi:TRAP-type C4-dicarboxylate transport system permease small subunit